MRFGGRVAAAIEVLEAMVSQRRPASVALRDWGASHRFAGSGDRAAIGTMVHDALRRRGSACHLFGNESARSQVLGALLLEWDHTHVTLNAAFDGDMFAPDVLTVDECRAIDANSLDGAPDAVRADCPEWCAPMFEAGFADCWVDEVAMLSKRPPLDLRVNGLKASAEKVLRGLQRHPVSPSDLLPNALRIPPIEGAGRHPNVQAEAGYQRGHFEIQDTGSQLAAALTGAAAGEQVLDYCAGGGGKTLAMAAMMENRGQLFAHDADRNRLAPIHDRLKRAGCRNVQVVSDVRDLAEQAGKFDLVLVDAPCTGSGTWRRKPDAKWRLNAAQLEKRLSEQREILEAAKHFVKPGGRLAYVTCSLFPQENHDQIGAFFKANPDFEPVDHEVLWTALVPGSIDAAYIDPAGITMTPLRTGTDGFFFSMLQNTISG